MNIIVSIYIKTIVSDSLFRQLNQRFWLLFIRCIGLRGHRLGMLGSHI